MLRGGWGKLVAIGVAALLGVGAGGYIYVTADASQAIYELEAEQRADAYREAAVSEKQGCPAVASPEQPRCLSEAEERAREAQRKEYDLQAQLVTSAWTRAMGLAAIIAMLVGFVGVGLVFTTFRETRRAADAAHTANRPWLTVEVVSLRLRLHMGCDDADMEVAIKVANCGKSPALYVNTVAVLYAEHGKTPGMRVGAASKKVDEWLSCHSGGLKDITGTTVFPGTDVVENCVARLHWDEVPKAMESGSVCLVLGVGVIYHFGEQEGRTVVAFDVWRAGHVDRPFPIPGPNTGHTYNVILLDNCSGRAT